MSKSRQQRFRDLAKAPLLFAALALAGPNVAAADVPTPQGEGQADDLERLQRMLQEPGPDGRETREQAVAQLLAMARPAAHRLLQERLLREQDPDGLRATILTGLQRHLLGAVSSQFGGADAEVRQQILIGYLGACAPLWAEGVDAEVRQMACATLQRVPARELDGAARALMSSGGDPASHVHVLYCLSDLQQTLLAGTIADQLEAPDEAMREAAREALHRLTYAEPKITTKAGFDAWHETYGSWRYVDLAQRAARRGPQPLEELRRQLARQRIDAAREFVTAHVARNPGVDWAIVQERTVSEEPAVLDACLETLQALLSRVPVGEGNAIQRQTFCRALLDRFKQVPAEMRPELHNRRALLLEVAAYLARPQEVELANEIRTQLLAQLKSGPRELQIAALRGLRRYPSPEARATLVGYARRLLPTIDENQTELLMILETLASRTAPRWPAPEKDAVDKADWLQLVTDCCRSDERYELRTSALKLAQTLDRDEDRLPEAFGILMKLVRDSSLDTKFRSTAMIYLEAWRSDEDLANEWVAALHALLEDDAALLRKQAADSLARLGESVDPRRGDWFASSIRVLRERLFAEPDSAVLNALVECVRKIGKQPQMPELAIGTLKYVLGRIEKPVPAEHQFRLDPLLVVLAEIAADRNAETDQWQAACEPLLLHGKRASVRLVLKSHAAIDLTKGVSSSNEAEADRARRAMRLIIEAATLKPDRTSWTSTEELRREARDVRTAFVALDAADAAHRPDERRHRVLRLSVDLVAGKWSEVVQRSTEWLQGANGAGDATAGAAEAYLDRLRLLAAEAYLSLSKPKDAEAMLAARSANGAADPEALDLGSRVARALVANDPRAATALFERTLRATATEDPAFRVRLVDWMRCRLKHDPDSRTDTLREAGQHSGLFAADDCPAELRQEFEQLLKAD